MSAGYWGDTNLVFKPGIALSCNNGTSASTWESRLSTLYTPSRLAFWLKSGVYANGFVRISWSDLMTASNTAPSDESDPDDPGYNWTLLDDLCAVPMFQSGVNMMLAFRIVTSGIPNWMISANETWVNSNNVRQLKMYQSSCQQHVIDFLTAVYNRYSGSNVFWFNDIGEAQGGSSANWPVGLTQDGQQQGYANVLNTLQDLWGGSCMMGMGGNSISLAIQYTQPLIAFVHPDPKMFTSGCTPTCTPGTAKAVMQQNLQTRPMFQGFEYNGTKDPIQWPDGITNPFGYNSSTPPHLPTARELVWYHSQEGVMPVPLIYFSTYEWGNGGLSHLNLAAYVDAFDAYMAGGSDIVPFLPDNYDGDDTTPPGGGGTGTMTFVAAGSLVTGSTSGLSPTQPAGKAVGDLLLCASACRSVTETANAAPSSWLNLNIFSNNGLQLYAKYAEDTDTTQSSSDAIVSHDFWSGTNQNSAQIIAFSGDVPESLSTMIVASASKTSGSENSDITFPGLSVPIDNCVILAAGRKSKTVTSDGVTYTSPSGMDNRIGYTATNGFSVVFVWDYTIQTTKADLSAGVWTASEAQALSDKSFVIAIQPSGGEDTTAPALHATDEPTGTAQSQTVIRWTWNNATDAVGVLEYDLQTSTNGTDWTFLHTITQAQKTADGYYDQTGLAANTLYYMRYRARDAAGNASAYSDSGSETTDTPTDSTPPTFGGITSVSYDDVTGDVTLSFSEGSDDVSAQTALRYFAHVAIDPSTPDFDVDDYGPFTDVSTIVIDDLPDETYNIGVSCKDEAGNRSTNTDTEQVVVGLATVSGTIAACENNTGSDVDSGDTYMYIAPEGTPLQNVNLTDPASDSSAKLVIFNGDGTVTVSQVGDAGDYHGLLVNSDGSSITKFNVTMA